MSVKTAMSSVEVRGILWPPMVTEETLSAIEHFQVRDDDVFVATFPKSGTHWMTEICHLILNDGDLDRVDREQVPMPLEFEEMAYEKRKARYQAAPSWKSPRVVVTHVPKQLLPEQLRTEQTKAKVITVIRNPKDIMVSYHHFEKGIDTPPDETFEECLQKRLFGDKVEFTSWFDHVLGYWAERHNKRHLILKYEDMKRDTRGAVVQVAHFLGRPLEDSVIDKITSQVTLRSMGARFHKSGEVPHEAPTKIGARNLIRKGVVGDWKTTFTVAMSEALDELYRNKMAGSGLVVQFE